MKSTITNKSIGQAIQYPCLMVASDGDIVLFFGPSEGVAVHVTPEDGNVIGEYCNTWKMHYFQPFHGTVTLENGE